MNWLNRLLRGTSSTRLVEALAFRLMAHDEPTFFNGLREAVSYAPRGDDFGVHALNEAIRRRVGKAAR